MKTSITLEAWIHPALGEVIKDYLQRHLRNELRRPPWDSLLRTQDHPNHEMPGYLLTLRADQLADVVAIIAATEVSLEGIIRRHNISSDQLQQANKLKTALDDLSRKFKALIPPVIDWNSIHPPKDKDRYLINSSVIGDGQIFWMPNSICGHVVGTTVDQTDVSSTLTRNYARIVILAGTDRKGQFPIREYRLREAHPLEALAAQSE